MSDKRYIQMTKKLKPGPKVGAGGGKKPCNITLVQADIEYLDSLADANRSRVRSCSRGDIVATLLDRNRQDPGTVDIKTMAIKRRT